MCSGKILSFSTCKMEQLHRTNSRAAWDWRDHLVPCEQSEAPKGEEQILFIPAGTFPATVAKSTSKQSKAQSKNSVAAETRRGLQRAIAQLDQPSDSISFFCLHKYVLNADYILGIMAGSWAPKDTTVKFCLLRKFSAMWRNYLSSS